MELSAASEDKTHHDSTDVSDRAGWPIRERNHPSCKEALTAALGLLLLCALVAHSVLGILYNNKKASYEALSEQYSSAVERLSVQERNASELKSHWDQVQVNYENAVKRLEAFKEECQKCALCAEGWRSFGAKCYYFSTNELNWMNSRDYCAEKGGHLVIITSQAEQDFLSSRAHETHWIGLNDLETEGKWVWVNNQTLTETGVTFWHKRKDEAHEPDNWREEDESGENCAALGNESSGTYIWFDASCLKKKKYICQK
ncbi:CD209 antigen-like protein C [Colossoma macropomum]|uniref:CD209 antigen-like protein C n=1 Tax=Colossoma macropomum TaxID=42526 RepID=UPI001864B794|nr:CD209 antigen-like protein C [Colossoma macropomum]